MYFKIPNIRIRILREIWGASMLGESPCTYIVCIGTCSVRCFELVVCSSCLQCSAGNMSPVSGYYYDGTDVIDVHTSRGAQVGQSYVWRKICSMANCHTCTVPARHCTSGRRAETRARDDDDTCIRARRGSLRRVHRPVTRDSQRANRLYRPTHPIVKRRLNINSIIYTFHRYTRLCLYRLGIYKQLQTYSYSLQFVYIVHSNKALVEIIYYIVIVLTHMYR